MYTENYKTLVKLNMTQINGKVFHVCGLEELVLLKCPYHLKQLTDFNAIPSKTPMAFFVELES